MAGDRMLRPVERLLAAAVDETVDALDLDAADTAVARLARAYAATIDTTVGGHECGGYRAVMNDLGPKLLAALDALGATPQARSRRKGGGGDRAGEGKLQALREARR
jgi:hypothetical protein